MSVEALIKMRDDIGKMLSGKAGQLQQPGNRPSQWRLGKLGKEGRRPSQRKHAQRQEGQTYKYRNPKNRKTWAGRGAVPRWMAAAIKGGKKKESFLIDKSAAKTAAKPKRVPVAKAKRGRPVKKRQKAAAPAGNGAAAAAGENT